MTPADLALCVETYRQRHEDEYIERLSMTWYTAKWSQAKKIPPLQKMIDEIRSSNQPSDRKRNQTPEEMFAAAMRLNAVKKGDVIMKGVNEHGRST